MHPPHLQPVAAEPPPPSVGDELVAAALAGNVQAWSVLYQREYAGVYRQVRYLTGDPSVTEELVQETFAQAMASARRFDPRRRFDAWLHGIALNVVRQLWRRTRTEVRAHARLEVATAISRRHDGPDLSHLQRERSRALYAALAELPDRWREAFVLRELQGIEAAEVARRLGVTTGNVHVRVTRARARLRELLSQRGWVDEPEAMGGGA